jgi:hypothetical protein
MFFCIHRAVVVRLALHFSVAVSTLQVLVMDLWSINWSLCADDVQSQKKNINDGDFSSSPGNQSRDSYIR